MRQTLFDDLLCLGVVFGVGGFDERDGLRQHGDVAREDAGDILSGGKRPLLAPHEVGIYDRLVINALCDVKRRVVMRVRILLFVVFDFREIHDSS